MIASSLAELEVSGPGLRPTSPDIIRRHARQNKSTELGRRLRKHANKKVVRTFASFSSMIMSLIYAGSRKHLSVHSTHTGPHSWLGICSQQKIALIRANVVRYYLSEGRDAVSPKDQTGCKSRRAPLLTAFCSRVDSVQTTHGHGHQS